MIQLASIQPINTLFGGVTVYAYVRNGSTGRYRLQTKEYDAGQDMEAEAFAKECDRKMIIQRLQAFIDQAANGMSYRWYTQRMWVAGARLQLSEMRGYLAHMQRVNVSHEAIAQFAELAETALIKSKPPHYLTGAIALWDGITKLCKDFQDKYSLIQNAYTHE